MYKSEKIVKDQQSFKKKKKELYLLIYIQNDLYQPFMKAKNCAQAYLSNKMLEKNKY